MRTVELDSFDADAFDVIKEKAGYVEFTQAIGYLSTWCLKSYPRVKIWADPKQMEMTATYWKEDGSVGYVIGAVWHGEKFGFHS